jgi:hypothetical protein
MGDQGTGGIESRGSRGIENNSRRMSEACANPRDENIQQPNTEAKTPSAEVETQAKSGPRRVYAQTPTPGALSRNPSTSSNVSAAHATGYFDQVPRSSSLRQRPLEPPVTKTTLSELDVNKIIHNPKLRHDINFDPELHFRPNLDGEKGRRKQDKANQFWNALSEQLQQFVVARDEFMRRYGNGEEWCLPLLSRHSYQRETGCTWMRGSTSS